MIIPQEIWHQMTQRADTNYPDEVCGLLSGKEGWVTGHYPITTQLHSERLFFMNPGEMVRAMDLYETRGEELLAIYHSHPNGKGELSKTDIQQDFYPGVVKFILSGEPGNWQGTAWQTSPANPPKEVTWKMLSETN